MFSSVQIDGVATEASCGGNNGSIQITIISGQPPFSYFWTPNGETTPSIFNLGSGTYTVTVTDANGCTFTESYIVPGSSFPNVTIQASDYACEADGEIDLTVSGGVPPFNYQWSNGANTEDLTNLLAGTYEVIVTDANGCFTMATVTIASQIHFGVTTTFADCDLQNGTATASILGGGTGSFAWSNGGTTAQQTNLAPGWYSVTVTETNTNCQSHQNFEVLEDTICYVRISGYVYVDDVNPDCIVDGSTIAASNVGILLDDGQMTFSDANGYYEFISHDPGDFSVSLDYNPNIFEPLCVDPIPVNAPTYGQTYPGSDFSLAFGPDHDIKVHVNKNNARPGFTQFVNIYLMNEGGMPVSGTLSFVHPDIQEYDSSSPSATTYEEASHTLTWEYDNIPPNTTWIYTTYLHTPVGTSSGTPLEYQFVAEPIADDLTPDNNSEVCNAVVTNSWDPNDKAVTPQGIGPEGIISMADSVLNYRIRFQNTGTDTAFTVLIRDTLDADLDVLSLDLGPASHPYSATINDGNVLEFLFEDILLPDSNINEPASYGVVFFNVHIQPGSGYGTRIDNRAGIYFDFNPPVITNTVSNLIEMIISTTESNNAFTMSASPNPASGSTSIQYALEEGTFVQMDLIDREGRVVRRVIERMYQPQGEHRLEVGLAGVGPGVYFVLLQSDGGAVGWLKVVVD